MVVVYLLRFGSTPPFTLMYIIRDGTHLPAYHAPGRSAADWQLCRRLAVFVVSCAHPGWLQFERIPRSETPLRSGRTTAYDTTIVERPPPLGFTIHKRKSGSSPIFLEKNSRRLGHYHKLSHWYEGKFRCFFYVC